MKIYGDIRSGNCCKIKYICDFLRIPYTWIDIDISKHQSKTPQFLKMNSSGQVPVVEFDDGRYLAQSNAIIRFLARNSSLIPKDPFDEAKMDEWLFWEQYSHEPAIAVLRYKYVYLGLTTEEIDPALIKKSDWALDIMNSHLDKSRFFVSQQCTVADVALFAYTRLAAEAHIDLAEFPNIQRWLNDTEKYLF